MPISSPHKYILYFIVCLILTLGHITSANAVTDAELEALEKQIEILEEEEKRQTEAAEKKKMAAKSEAKLKAEQLRKANNEAERKRLAELERLQLEQQMMKKKEQEKKEQYDKFIIGAERATIKNNFDLGENNYRKALKIYNNDEKAQAGIKHIQGLKNICQSIIGGMCK